MNSPTLDRPISAPASSLSMGKMALMGAIVLIGWKGGERIGLFGASILGPMNVTAALSLSGFIHTRPPAEAVLTAQFMIGLGIGVGYVGITMIQLRKNVLSAVFSS
ncbi:MAG: AbrB family transcriptional regulator [Rhizobiaceae bacterium]|nr:AbrB family transcriptional regulator [Rhizobiaceae bacterium]